VEFLVSLGAQKKQLSGGKKILGKMAKGGGEGGAANKRGQKTPQILNEKKRGCNSPSRTAGRVALQEEDKEEETAATSQEKGCGVGGRRGGGEPSFFLRPGNRWGPDQVQPWLRGKREKGALGGEERRRRSLRFNSRGGFKKPRKLYGNAREKRKSLIA